METARREVETPRFKFVGGVLCLDFANTVGNHSGPNPNEYIRSYADLVAWATAADLISEAEASSLREMAVAQPAAAETALERAITLREAIFQIFSRFAAGDDLPADAVTTLNRELSQALRHARVEPDANGFAWGWAEPLSEGLDRLGWPIVASAAQLLTSAECSRVRLCAGDGCGWLFLDTSRNRSRRWCDMADCGNRAKARRHYHRTRAAQRG